MKFFKRGGKAEVGSIDLLEEATHLLRRAPLTAWLAYYGGALPFGLALLYFIADMSRGARAWDHLPEHALLLALLFVLMKTGQACYCDRLLQQLGDEPKHKLRGRLSRVFFAQLALQPVGLFLLPVALLLTLPFGWCFALFQNYAVFGQGREPLRREISRSWQQAQLWPGQNHLVIGLMSVYALALIPAIAVSLYILPHLLHRLFGIDSIFTQSYRYLFSTPFWSVVFLLSYLCFDPLVKAVYVLRCFYGASQANGADLRVELRQLQAAVLKGVTGLVAALLLLGGAGPLRAEQQQVAPQELRQAMQSEMGAPIYQWRLPREPVPDDYDPGFLATLGDSLVEALRWLGEQLKDLIEAIIDWFRTLLPDPDPEAAPTSSFIEGTDPLLLALYLLGGIGLAMAGVWLYRLWKRRRRREKPLVEPELAIPDLEAEEVSAAELPADRWCSLARELMAKGDLRLALRALLLGALARLADVGYLQLARYKSNRDYLLELGRSGAALTEVRQALGENVMTMESVWYGDHAIDQESMQAYLARHERIMRHG